MTKIRKFVFWYFPIDGAGRILVNHSLTVLEAVLLFLVYCVFRKRASLKELSVIGDKRRAAKIGLISGLITFIMTIPVALYFGMKISPHFSSIEAFGNLFSNAGEEFIYRGILFTAGLAMFRSNWMSILISGIIFGLGHWDLPYLFQAYIAIVGVIFGITYVRSESLAAPYIAHMISDLLLDSLFQ